MNIYRDRKRGHLWLTQRSYLEKIANLFDMNNTKVVSTTLANHFKLSKFQYLKTESDIAEMIKFLMLILLILSCMLWFVQC